MNFLVLKNAVAKQFERMQKHQLYRANVERDVLYATYLESFPDGTNPIFRVRTEHDCGCCKHFIRAIGDVVAIIDGKIESIWDISVPEEPGYQVVADAMSKLVKGAKIADVFFHYESTAGSKPNFEDIIGEGVKTWNHFFVNINAKFVIAKARIASTINGPRTAKEVLVRALEEIDMEAVDTVLELMAQRSLYRGDEHKFSVDGFRKLKKEYAKLKTDDEKEIFAWQQSQAVHGAISGIRNSVIGSLLKDLTEGKDLDASVDAYGNKMDPMNYKRPTSLVTKAMVEKAKETVNQIGLTSALDRRRATIHDITINNIRFADRSAKKVMGGDIFDELAASTSSKIKSMDKVEEVPIERFLAEILPRAESLEVLFENRHLSNLVSLIAPVDPTAGRLFKWDNNFSWSYAGGVADSIKERVKKAGGNVSGDLCCRLAWYNHDDLDFHMKEPGGYEIYFGTKTHKSPNGGRLDVDMNAGYGTTREPVENIYYETRRGMKEGVYSLFVNQFNKRETTDVGFEVELDFMGTVHRFVYDKSVANKTNVSVVKFKYTHKDGIEIMESLPSTQVSKNIWGLPTQTFHKVDVMMLSPNFWDDKASGNKHFFFMLNGCKSDDPARGFLNEFLKEELSPHRKVFEMIGSKMKVAESDEQLSGLGFSSTQRNNLTVRVKGSFTRTINIVF